MSCMAPPAPGDARQGGGPAAGIRAGVALACVVRGSGGLRVSCGVATRRVVWRCRGSASRARARNLVYRGLLASVARRRGLGGASGGRGGRSVRPPRSAEAPCPTGQPRRYQPLLGVGSPSSWALALVLELRHRGVKLARRAAGERLADVSQERADAQSLLVGQLVQRLVGVTAHAHHDGAKDRFEGLHRVNGRFGSLRWVCCQLRESRNLLLIVRKPLRQPGGVTIFPVTACYPSQPDRCT